MTEPILPKKKTPATLLAEKEEAAVRAQLFKRFNSRKFGYVMIAGGLMGL